MIESLNTLHPAIYGMAGALLGSIIGAGGTILVTYIAKRAEDRRHVRELAVTWGIQAWKNDYDIAKLWPSASAISPVDDYILHAILTSDALFKAKKLSEQELIDAVVESRELVKRIGEVRKTFGPLRTS